MDRERNKEMLKVYYIHYYYILYHHHHHFLNDNKTDSKMLWQHGSSSSFSTLSKGRIPCNLATTLILEIDTSTLAHCWKPLLALLVLVAAAAVRVQPLREVARGALPGLLARVRVLPVGGAAARVRHLRPALRRQRVPLGRGPHLLACCSETLHFLFKSLKLYVKLLCFLNDIGFCFHQLIHYFLNLVQLVTIVDFMHCG
mmetsp:Transcript_11575/g.19248  ORF Transcript_11575/g.19248 Transcript_11575/m.19248 type:complete len:200 (+) Transcript_11575:2-601(+)